MDKDVLQGLLGRGLSLQRIADRLGLHPSTVGYWVRKHGLSAVHARRHAARGGIPRELLEDMVLNGGSVASIASELGVSGATVRHWLRKHGIETKRTVHVRQTRAAKAGGRVRIQRECSSHGPTQFTLDRDGVYRCLRCRSEAVARRRRLVRETLVREAGGRCATCGYDSYVGALQFHHLDPSAKEFGLSSRGVTRSLESLRAEAKKCILLCANCHAEVEAGLRGLSVQLLGR
jgi:transposase-like protein/DNA-directed RNA polymerase subunit RPC12/RpoP